jgi:hypothetical protein
MQRHPWLTNFVLNERQLGPAAAFARSALGQKVTEVVLSRDALTAVIGAIDAAPARPPQPALDRYLLPVIGLAALDDNVKQLSGRILRQVVEHLGGRHERKGVPVNVASAYANGSIYTLPTTKRGKLSAADRRAWAEQQVAA